jgi:hypothetical protein
VRDADRSSELLRLLLDGVEEGGSGDGVTAAELDRLLSHPLKPDETDSYPSLRAAVAELCGAKSDPRKIGYRLRSYVGRVCGGRRLTKTKGHKGLILWSVESVKGDGGGDGGDGGDTSHPSRTEIKNMNCENREETRIRNQNGEGLETSPPSPPSPPLDGCPDDSHDWQDTAESDGRTRRFCRRCYQFAGFVLADGS